MTLCAATLREVVGPVKDLTETSMAARAAAAVEDLSDAEDQGEASGNGNTDSMRSHSSRGGLLYSVLIGWL